MKISEVKKGDILLCKKYKKAWNDPDFLLKEGKKYRVVEVRERYGNVLVKDESGFTHAYDISRFALHIKAKFRRLDNAKA